jgi:hypothetical protein
MASTLTVSLSLVKNAALLCRTLATMAKTTSTVSCDNFRNETLTGLPGKASFSNTMPIMSSGSNPRHMYVKSSLKAL